MDGKFIYLTTIGEQDEYLWKRVQKNIDMAPVSSAGGLLSFDEFDHFFDDFLSRRWPRIFDWNLPSRMERAFPKVDIIDHDNEIEV